MSKSQRPSRIPLIVVAVPFGVACAVIASAVDLGWWMAVAFVAFFLVIWVVVFQRALADASGLGLDLDAQPCPRCAERLRAERGWCEPCEGALVAAGPPLGEPMTSFLPAVAVLDLPRLGPTFADSITASAADGRSRTVSRNSYLGSLRMLRAATSKLDGDVLAAHADPDDPRTTWAVTHGALRWRFTRQTLELVAVQRYVTDFHGKIAELHAFAPLAEPPSVRKRI